jgi:hypothetical protein
MKRLITLSRNARFVRDALLLGDIAVEYVQVTYSIQENIAHYEIINKKYTVEYNGTLPLYKHIAGNIYSNSEYERISELNIYVKSINVAGNNIPIDNVSDLIYGYTTVWLHVPSKSANKIATSLGNYIFNEIENIIYAEHESFASNIEMFSIIL